MWRLVGPALILGVVGAILGMKSAVVHFADVTVGALAGVACGLVVGASTYQRARTTARGVYLIAGSVVTWLVLALILPTFIGGSIGLDESIVRVIAIAATLSALIGVLAGVMAMRKGGT